MVTTLWLTIQTSGENMNELLAGEGVNWVNESYVKELTYLSSVYLIVYMTYIQNILL